MQINTSHLQVDASHVQIIASQTSQMHAHCKQSAQQCRAFRFSQSCLVSNRSSPEVELSMSWVKQASKYALAKLMADTVQIINCRSWSPVKN